ncbi:hypothetical protein [Roseomonas alba]|nr:hypothetical protein [Neoroseomonas alba]
MTKYVWDDRDLRLRMMAGGYARSSWGFGCFLRKRRRPENLASRFLSLLHSSLSQPVSPGQDIALIPVAALVASLVIPQSVSFASDALTPGAAHAAALSEARAVTYYSVEQGGAFRVVTTVATNADAAPLRATLTLQPGQVASISVPAASYGSASYEMTFRRDGDRLSVDAPRQQSAALR